jgi:crotonobetainyl-CoA:carnitine CoA-transferase CaiB-like acyl-CoA transferase
MKQAKAFAGVRILDFTHYLAGPFCTFQLAVQGADVIKVEAIGGDAMRLSGTSPEWTQRQLSPSWMAVNANKRSMTLDLTKPAAREIVERLAAEVDVVCENFRPGVLERRGMGWSQLSKINPRLIYCGISGFGSTGPERGTASFDGKIQAMSGLMSLTGEPVNGPMRAGFAVADITTGITAAFAVASALFQRTHTGEGQFVDVAMLDSMVGFLSGQVAEYTTTGQRHEQLGNGSVSGKPTADRFRCGKGFLVLAVLTDKQFGNLMRALGREEALRDPRFVDWPSRSANKGALRELIEDAMSEGDPASWERRLVDADAPCGQVNSIADVTAHPQLAHREMIQDVQTPYGPVRLAGSAFRMAHGTGGLDRPISLPGEHTDEVLASIGYDAQAIAALRADQVV